jgi:hypothetical protein
VRSTSAVVRDWLVRAAGIGALLVIAFCQGGRRLPSDAGRAEAAAGPDRDGVITVTWDRLALLNFRDGLVHAAVTTLRGRTVRVPGFIVPLEDLQDEAAVFLLVPYFGACIHTPPPPPNQMVYVEMKDRIPTRFEMWSPVWIEGVIDVRSIDSPYGLVSYHMTGLRVRPYEQ